MTQVLVLLNDAATGIKFQGMAKDTLIITFWPYWPANNCEYAVLSLVRALGRLYLIKFISITKAFQPTPELKAYVMHTRAVEKKTLKRRKGAMNRVYWMLHNK